MKKLIYIFLFIPLVSFGQSFEVYEKQVDDGKKFYQGTFKYFTPEIIIEATGTPDELYNKTLNWINETYKNPDEVIKGKVAGQYIRFDGFVGSLISQNVIGTKFYYDVRYTVEIKFKENRLKYEITKIEQYSPPYKSNPGRWYDIPFGVKVAKAKGRLDKKTGLRKPGKVNASGVKNFKSIKDYFEGLGVGIKEYLESGSSEPSTDDDW